MRSSRGFTLVEVIFATALLALAALLLMATLSSSERMSSLAREKSAANAAIRSYLERMRQQFPAQGSRDLSSFLADSQTPADFVATGAIEGSVLRGVRARVSKCRTENPAVNSAWSHVALSTGHTAAVMTQQDLDALGLPRDLNANGSANEAVAAASVLLVPMKIEIEWLSGSNVRIGATTQRQSLTVYAYFSTHH